MYWAALAFLLGFTIFLVFLSRYYLLPALDAVRHTNVPGRKELRAWSTLLLAIVLFILLVGLILTFRVGRFFLPRPPAKRVRTKYVDAWAESGKRLETVSDEDEDEDQDEEEEDDQEEDEEDGEGHGAR
jgi:hypothetical protein